MNIEKIKAIVKKIFNFLGIQIDIFIRFFYSKTFKGIVTFPITGLFAISSILFILAEGANKHLNIFSAFLFKHDKLTFALGICLWILTIFILYSAW